MIVVDASVWALALTVDSAEASAARRLLADDTHWAMPTHGPLETLRTIRRFEATGPLSPELATAAIDAMCATELELAEPSASMLRDVWALRHRISPYDAAYVALAARHERPLVTFDKRLARAASDTGVTAIVPTDH
ncbi:MAG TPA: type II toxin-antitoxin system VapC family toxin [Candidatus Corynebacterium avicola]|uniref:Ribonuclease VapC n=1 Tax=Candidatus Corynebacterium avicola TaxID=2838527 RepID=A0A9D1RTH5_9CORY|nr:type II toxin-antitoxin system VapC family toxin [Candidatus Corynebacterium avicola]